MVGFAWLDLLKSLHTFLIKLQKKKSKNKYRDTELSRVTFKFEYIKVLVFDNTVLKIVIY